MSNRGKVIFIVGVLLFLAGVFVLSTGPGSDLDFWQLSSNYADIPGDFKDLITDALLMTQEITNKPTNEISFDRVENRFENWSGSAWAMLPQQIFGTATNLNSSWYRSNETRIVQTATEIVLNEDSRDRDVRMESDSDANAFVLDASTSRIGFGTNTPTREIDILGDKTIMLGCTYNTTARTTGTVKTGHIVFPHFRSATEEAVAGINCYTDSANNYLEIGGVGVAAGIGEAEQNAATEIRFFTAADNKTIRGTERFSIESDGDLFYYSAPSGTGNDLELNAFEIFENTSMTADKRDFEPWTMTEEKKDGLLSLADKIQQYQRKDRPDRVKKEIGLTAEDVFAAFPDLCNYNDSGEIIGVRYKMAGFYLIPIVAEQQDRIEQLTAANAALQRRVEALEEKAGKGGEL